MRIALATLTVGTLAACHSDAATAPNDGVRLDSGLTVRAESSVVGGDAAPSVQVRAIFTNRTKTPLSNDVSDCVVRVRVTRVADGAVVLDEAAGNVNYLCDPRTVTLLPGAADTAYRAVVGASLGIHAVGARFHVESVVRGPTGTLLVDAGTVAVP
jgi:hypothetical protein